MKRPVAQALAARITHLIDTHSPGNGAVAREARARLLARSTRHLPAPGAPEGSPLWPPAYALRLAHALGLDETIALGFAAAGALFFGAADLADDIADGEVDDVANGVNDVCRLLMMTQAALLTLEGVDAKDRESLAREFAAEGQTMALGQELDLRGTNAMDAAAPEEIATLKSGAEFVLFTAGPARLAGRDPAPFADFGRAFGCLGQTLSDAFDLFLDPDGDDWTQRKPTFALRHALGSAPQGHPLRRMLAGANHRPDRRGPGLWYLVDRGAGPRLAEIRDACVAQMTAACDAIDDVPLLSTLRDEVAEWTTGVCDALAEFAQVPVPPATDMAEELPEARATVSAFLTDRALPTLAERQVRWGPLGALARPDPWLARFIVHELRLAHVGTGSAEARALVEATPPVGWTRFDHPDAPLCTETTARALRLAARMGMTTAPNMISAGRALSAHQRRDGLFDSWFGAKRDKRIKPFVARWGDAPCPAQSAWATLALWSMAPGASKSAVKGAQALARLFAGEETPASPFYGPMTVEVAGARALKAVGPALSSKGKQAADDALSAIRRRTLKKLRLDGRMGNVLETAQGAWLLHHLEAMPAMAPTLRSLMDAQDVDGGYPANPFRREAGPGGETRWWGERALTAAFVERLLGAVDP